MSRAKRRSNPVVASPRFGPEEQAIYELPLNSYCAGRDRSAPAGCRGSGSRFCCPASTRGRYPKAAEHLNPDSPDEMTFGQLRAPISIVRSDAYAGSSSRILTDPTGERRNWQFCQHFRGLRSCRPNPSGKSGLNSLLLGNTIIIAFPPMTAFSRHFLPNGTCPSSRGLIGSPAAACPP